jgi:high-affinity Fe2+/Pb2+ permease
MNMGNSLRQFHRWTSIVFTVAVVINLIAVAMKQQATWIGLLALFPLVLLMITGLYMFAKPYFAQRRIVEQAK